MPVTVRDQHQSSNANAPLFTETEHTAHTATGRGDKRQVCWKVQVWPDDHKIIRNVWYDGNRWNPEREEWQPDGVIWPAWPASLEDQAALADSPLKGAQDYWAKVGTRLRDSAKWMATVLGAALAAIVGTSPLTIWAAHHPRGLAAAAGVIGVGLLYLTLFLVLQVMRPQSVSYADCNWQARYGAGR